jgi:glycosyltransferase involved in cell wall biosynthesis
VESLQTVRAASRHESVNPNAVLPPNGVATEPRFVASATPEVAVVIPCLNEAETIGRCVTKAATALRSAGIAGEIIVADNGSTDGSQAIAERLGATVVAVPRKGYGMALQGGIAFASAPLVIMGDADDSYDFLELPRFVAELRRGADLVQGCRLPSGGGRVAEGAMPWAHRWIGNPFFSLLARWWFRAPIHDVYCGLRGFRRESILQLGLRESGMVFAIEMVLRSARARHTIRELPITLHKDGRTAHRGHLKTMRDGWRTLRFFVAERMRAA